MNQHTSFIQRAIELAGQAYEKGNLPFGALLVRDGSIVLEVENTSQSENDVTRHAVLNLISCASRQLSEKELHDSVLYASTEPCPMCAGAVYWAGIKRVVYACSSRTFHEISGNGLDMDCRKIFDVCHPRLEVIGPIDEELACEHLMSYWPHPS